jgi:hypothetical protein
MLMSNPAPGTPSWRTGDEGNKAVLANKAIAEIEEHHPLRKRVPRTS